MSKYFKALLGTVGIALGLSLFCLPAMAQITVAGTSGTGQAVSIDFGSVQLNTTKVMTITLTTDATVTFANPAAITTSLSGTPFSLDSGDDGCATKPATTAGSCTIAVRYTPTTETSSAAYFRVATTAPAGYPGVFVNLVGTGITGGASPAGTLNISPTSSLASPIPISTKVKVSGSQILTLTATGGAVSISGIAVPDKWALKDLCGSSVVPGNPCVIMLYTPLYDEQGSYPETYVLQTSNGPKTVYVSANVSDVATGASGTLTVSPTSLNFSTVRPGSTSVKTITLSAAGQNVALTSIKVPTGFVESDSCGNLIPAGGLCTASITFTPTSEVPYNGSVVITSNATASPHFVTLTGTGSASAVQQSLVTVSPATIDFGTLRPGSKLTKSVTITSNGTNVALNGITMPSANFTLTNSSCGTLIPAGGSCAVSITFAPTAKIPYDGSAVIDITDAPHFITLKATGGDSTSSGGGTTGSVPMLVLDDSLLSFGNLATGSSSQKTLSMANRGGAALSATPTISGTGFSIVSGGCVSGGAISLAAGATCTLTVKFAPTSIGTKTGRIQFSGTGATGIEITLNGVGTGSGSGSGSSSSGTGLSATATNLAFGSVAVGGSSVKTVALYTAGGSRPSIASVVTPAGFVASHDCATAIGTSCTLTLALTPQAETTYQGLVVVSATDGSAVFITVSGQGSAAAQMTARTRGGNTALDMTGVFRFAAEQASSAGNLYVAVLYNEALYFFSGGRWTAYVAGVEPPAYATAASASNEITILVGQDISAVSGAVIFLGYGRSFDEVVSKHQYTPVYVVE